MVLISCLNWLKMGFVFMSLVVHLEVHQWYRERVLSTHLYLEKAEIELGSLNVYNPFDFFQLEVGSYLCQTWNKY